MKKRLNGSQILVEVLKKQGVEYIFGYPGGACMPIFDALVDAPELKIILVRHEQGATHMADGYARATGKTGVVLVTSGPGATNTVTGILTAHMDSVPLVVLTGQTITPNLGKDAFQEADVFGVTMPVVKHSYLVRDVKDLSRIVKEAFHLASTGQMWFRKNGQRIFRQKWICRDMQYQQVGTQVALKKYLGCWQNQNAPCFMLELVL